MRDKYYEVYSEIDVSSFRNYAITHTVALRILLGKNLLLKNAGRIYLFDQTVRINKRYLASDRLTDCSFATLFMNR